MIFFGLKQFFQYLMARANLPTLAFRPFRLTFRYGVLIYASMMVLNVWGVRTDALLTVAGTILGLVAIGFVAVWSVLSNVLCTFVLIMFKPFAVGDELEVPADAVRGKVVDLTLIFTTLRSSQGSISRCPTTCSFRRSSNAGRRDRQFRSNNSWARSMPWSGTKARVRLPASEAPTSNDPGSRESFALRTF